MESTIVSISVTVEQARIVKKTLDVTNRIFSAELKQDNPIGDLLQQIWNALPANFATDDEDFAISPSASQLDS